MSVSTQTAQRLDRRRNFRVELTLGVRLNQRTGEVDAGGDLVEQYEELGRAAQRFRKTTSPSGRQFVDSLMGVLDRLTALAGDQASAGGWSPRVVVRANLSAGGIGFISTSPHAVGDAIAIEFVFPDELSQVPIRSNGRVTRCVPQGVSLFDLGIEFEEMTSVTQERLIRVLFEVQRRRLRSRRGSR